MYQVGDILDISGQPLLWEIKYLGDDYVFMVATEDVSTPIDLHTCTRTMSRRFFDTQEKVYRGQSTR